VVNPLNRDDFTNFQNAVVTNQQAGAVFRKNRAEAIRELVGKHYSNDGASDKVPANFIELAYIIYVMNLAAQTPNVHVETPHQVLKPFAKTLALGMNHLLEEILFGNTVQSAVGDALFAMAIVKTGLNQSGTVEIGGVLHDVGQPYSGLVDLDDWVHDFTARDWQETQFQGNRYRIPYAHVMEAGIFDNIDGLKPTNKYGPYDDIGEEFVKNISEGYQVDKDEIQPYSELWDFWLPNVGREKLIMTCALDQPHLPPLRVREWEGPEGGMYDILGFERVPGNGMPLPPASVWRDMHELANMLFRKIGRQAQRQKSILGFQAGDEEDVERINSTSDGNAARIDNPEKSKELNYGGFNPANLALFLQTKDLFSWFAGNLDTLGGLGPLADTLGQENLLNDNSSRRIAYMEGKTYEFVQSIVKKQAYYLVYDPLIDLPLVKRVEGFGIDIPIRLTADTMEGDFLDYNFTIEPFSMRYRTPEMQFQQLMEVIERVVLPLAPMMPAQGMTINVEALIKEIADLRRMPVLNRIIGYLRPEQIMQMGPVGEFPAKPPVTTRHTIRTNRPGATRTGKDAAMMHTLLGAGVQDSEMAALNRGNT